MSFRLDFYIHVFFFSVAGHFLGNDTVVDRLQRMGFEIEHTVADHRIPR